MGVCGSPGSCFGGTGNETCDTAAGRPQWVLLFVHANRERKVAEGLQTKGYEVFLPMHTVRRQWSDRVKTYDAPLDRKSTRLNSSHLGISYAVFCLKKK